MLITVILCYVWSNVLRKYIVNVEWIIWKLDQNNSYLWHKSVRILPYICPGNLSTHSPTLHHLKQKYRDITNFCNRSEQVSRALQTALKDATGINKWTYIFQITSLNQQFQRNLHSRCNWGSSTKKLAWSVTKQKQNKRRLCHRNETECITSEFQGH